MKEFMIASIASNAQPKAGLPYPTPLHGGSSLRLEDGTVVVEVKS